jgi:hypothetical protein
MRVLGRTLSLISCFALAAHAAGVWQSAGHPIQDFWVGPFPLISSSTVLAVRVENDTRVYYCVMNGAEPSKSIFPSVQAAAANGNPIFPSLKPCVAVSDGTTWCEMDGIHLGK